MENPFSSAQSLRRDWTTLWKARGTMNKSPSQSTPRQGRRRWEASLMLYPIFGNECPAHQLSQALRASYSFFYYGAGGEQSRRTSQGEKEGDVQLLPWPQGQQQESASGEGSQPEGGWHPAEANRMG